MLTKRKMVIGLVMLLGIVWVNAALAFQNEPTGFRGNSWGTPIENLTFKVKKIKSLEEIKIDVYLVLPKRPEIGTMLVALDGKLAGVSAKLENEEFMESVAKTLIMAYGEPTEYTEESVIWKGNTTIIEFVPSLRTLTIGSVTGMMSVEALLEWYAANIKKRNI